MREERSKHNCFKFFLKIRSLFGNKYMVVTIIRIQFSIKFTIVIVFVYLLHYYQTILKIKGTWEKINKMSPKEYFAFNKFKYK